jgi:hypothetical protein
MRSRNGLRGDYSPQVGMTTGIRKPVPDEDDPSMPGRFSDSQARI